MDSKSVGNYISNRRKALGLTQQDLADRLGVTNKAVSRWETGEGYPDITFIRELSENLGVTTDELLSAGVAPSKNLSNISSKATQQTPT